MMDVNENETDEIGNLEMVESPNKVSRYHNFDSGWVDHLEIKLLIWGFRVKHVFVLTMAGKPVWARYGEEEATSALMGILFTLFSIVEENQDQIGEIELGAGRRMVTEKAANRNLANFQVYFTADPLILVSIGFGTSGQMRDELSIGKYV